jgi:hypothetical protein
MRATRLTVLPGTNKHLAAALKARIPQSTRTAIIHFHGHQKRRRAQTDTTAAPTCPCSRAVGTLVLEPTLSADPCAALSVTGVEAEPTARQSPQTRTQREHAKPPQRRVVDLVRSCRLALVVLHRKAPARRWPPLATVDAHRDSAHAVVGIRSWPDLEVTVRKTSHYQTRLTAIAKRELPGVAGESGAFGARCLPRVRSLPSLQPASPARVNAVGGSRNTPLTRWAQPTCARSPITNNRS